MVTHNVREFGRVPGLTVENWLNSPSPPHDRSVTGALSGGGFSGSFINRAAAIKPTHPVGCLTYAPLRSLLSMLHFELVPFNPR